MSRTYSVNTLNIKIFPEMIGTTCKSNWNFNLHSLFSEYEEICSKKQYTHLQQELQITGNHSWITEAHRVITRMHLTESKHRADWIYNICLQTSRFFKTFGQQDPDKALWRWVDWFVRLIGVNSEKGCDTASSLLHSNTFLPYHQSPLTWPCRQGLAQVDNGQQDW